MYSVKLTPADLTVSPLALGTTGFGTTLDQNEAFYQMDEFFKAATMRGEESSES